MKEKERVSLTWRKCWCHCFTIFYKVKGKAGSSMHLRDNELQQTRSIHRLSNLSHHFQSSDLHYPSFSKKGKFILGVFESYATLVSSMDHSPGCKRWSAFYQQLPSTFSRLLFQYNVTRDKFDLKSLTWEEIWFKV